MSEPIANRHRRRGTVALVPVSGMTRRAGLIFALVTTAFWGVWGAFAGLPAEHGFPETLIYVVWAFTMIPPALYALARVGWKSARGPALGAPGRASSA